jgi:hypothetical protein
MESDTKYCCDYGGMGCSYPAGGSITPKHSKEEVWKKMSEISVVLYDPEHLLLVNTRQ